MTSSRQPSQPRDGVVAVFAEKNNPNNPLFQVIERETADEEASFTIIDADQGVPSGALAEVVLRNIDHDEGSADLGMRVAGPVEDAYHLTVLDMRGAIEATLEAVGVEKGYFTDEHNVDEDTIRHIATSVSANNVYELSLVEAPQAIAA